MTGYSAILVAIVYTILPFPVSSYNLTNVSEANGTAAPINIYINMPKTYFIDRIYERYGRNQSNMNYTQFDTLYKRFLTYNNVTIYSAGKDQVGFESTADIKKREESENHHGHHHKRRKRNVFKSSGDSYKDRAMNLSVMSNTLCFDAADIFGIFDLKLNDTVNKVTFQEMCPAIIQQASGSHCVDTYNTNLTSNNQKQLWLLALLAVTVINLLSGLSVLLFPRQHTKWYPYTHIFILAMGVSVLVCDSLLHLFPHAIGLHFGHFEGESHVSSAHSSSESAPSFYGDSYLWKCLVTILGLFLFIMVEMSLIAFHDNHHSEEKPSRKGTALLDMNTKTKKRIGTDGSAKEEEVTLEIIQSHQDDRNIEEGVNETEKSNVRRQQDEEDIKRKIRKALRIDLFSTLFGKKETKDRDSNDGQGPSGVTKPVSKLKNAFRINLSSLKSVVWTIQIGDSVHNLIDGIIIGVAFTDSHGLHGGVSTAVTILIHEIPHEMSDFAFFLSMGLSVHQAMFLNFISSLFAYVGMIIGVTLNYYWANSTAWAFGATSGLFVYIALISMLPELKAHPILKTEPTTAIILEVIGLILGAGLMMILAGLEGSIGEQFG